MHSDMASDIEAPTVESPVDNHPNRSPLALLTLIQLASCNLGYKVCDTAHDRRGGAGSKSCRDPYKERCQIFSLYEQAILGILDL